MGRSGIGATPPLVSASTNDRFPAKAEIQTKHCPARRLRRSATAEQPFDVAERERHIGRAAVVALPAVGGRLHLAQEGVHLGRVEAAPGADAGMAGERAADMLD